ncbi:hypothetical protein ABKV19_027279 [Rosa sericea]
MFEDLNLASKQLRFISRFLLVCLLLNRREMVQQLLHQLKALVRLQEDLPGFQETDFKEWKLVIQEIVRFLKADTAFMNIRPLRYSIVLECHPDSLPPVSTLVVRRSLRLRDAILSSYHHNEVKFSELTLDTFRMLQCLEWEPSGSFYQPNFARNGQNGAPGSGRINYSQDIADPTLPHNPRKAVLYRPSVTHFLAVLATVCEELPSDGVILIYLSAAGINSIHPSDLVPFTRRPLFLVIDCDSSEAFEAINGVQKGETAAMLLSSSSSYQASDVGSSRQPSGSLFTIFLTAPMQAFCLLLGVSGTDIDMDIYNKAEKLLSSSLSDWGSTLATSDTIDPVWAQVLTDPFLRRLLLSVHLLSAVLSLYAPTFSKKEFIPKCVPCLPASFLPTTAACQTVILQIATQKDLHSQKIDRVTQKQCHVHESYRVKQKVHESIGWRVYFC